MKLPIRYIPDSDPPMFQWEQVVEGYGGLELIEHEGKVPVKLEAALVALIILAKSQAKEIETLKGELRMYQIKSSIREEVEEEKAKATPGIKKKGK